VRNNDDRITADKISKFWEGPFDDADGDIKGMFLFYAVDLIPVVAKHVTCETLAVHGLLEKTTPVQEALLHYAVTFYEGRWVTDHLQDVQAKNSNTELEKRKKRGGKTLSLKERNSYYKLLDEVTNRRTSDDAASWERAAKEEAKKRVAARRSGSATDSSSTGGDSEPSAATDSDAPVFNKVVHTFYIYEA